MGKQNKLKKLKIIYFPLIPLIWCRLDFLKKIILEKQKLNNYTMLCEIKKI